MLLQNAIQIQKEIGDERGCLPALRLMAAIAANEVNGVRDINTAASYYEEVLAIAEKLGDENERALALRGLSIVWQHRGDLEKALIYANESEGILERIGDRKSVAQVWRQKSSIRAQMGDYETAVTLAENTIKVSRELHDRLLEGFVLFELGKIYKKRHQLDEARDKLKQSYNIAKLLKLNFLIQISQNELESLGI